MRIVHFSDWHGAMHDLPAADLYVCTGDMLPNFRVFRYDLGGGRVLFYEENVELLGRTQQPRPPGKASGGPDFAREALLQTEWVDRVGRGYLRRRFAAQGAPVVCVRGNHDFIELAPLFEGGDTFEIGEDAGLTLALDLAGRRFNVGGFRGIASIFGRWADEIRADEFDRRVARLAPDLDLLVTHHPPHCILDRMHDGMLIGSPEIRRYVSRHDPAHPPLKAHLFGHIHEANGLVTLGATQFSNAATTHNVVDV